MLKCVEHLQIADLVCVVDYQVNCIVALPCVANEPDFCQWENPELRSCQSHFMTNEPYITARTIERELCMCATI